MKNTIIVISAIAATLLSGCTSTNLSTKTNDCEIVCIGMERSLTYGNCPGARLDSENMAKLLSKYGNVTLIQNEYGTRRHVKSAMEKAVRSKLAIVFYSGHGGSQKFRDTDPEEEADGKDEFLCLSDGALRDNEIWDIISKAQGRVFLIFDCCHSETMFREVGVSMSMVENAALPLDAQVNMLCWSGCADHTYSYGSRTGGELTNAIRRHFNEGVTYSDLWSAVFADPTLRKHQIAKRTQIGTGFDGECFK